MYALKYSLILTMTGMLTDTNSLLFVGTIAMFMLGGNTESNSKDRKNEHNDLLQGTLVLIVLVVISFAPSAWIAWQHGLSACTSKSKS